MELSSPRLVMDSAESKKEMAKSGQHPVNTVVVDGCDAGLVRRRYCVTPISVKFHRNNQSRVKKQE